MIATTHQGAWNVYHVSPGRWQAAAAWANPGDEYDGKLFPHFACSRTMSRRRCKRWVRLLAKRIKKGEVNQ